MRCSNIFWRSKFKANIRAKWEGQLASKTSYGDYLEIVDEQRFKSLQFVLKEVRELVKNGMPSSVFTDDYMLPGQIGEDLKKLEIGDFRDDPKLLKKYLEIMSVSPEDKTKKPLSQKIRTVLGTFASGVLGSSAYLITGKGPGYIAESTAKRIAQMRLAGLSTKGVQGLTGFAEVLGQPMLGAMLSYSTMESQGLMAEEHQYHTKGKGLSEKLTQEEVDRRIREQTSSGRRLKDVEQLDVVPKKKQDWLQTDMSDEDPHTFPQMTDDERTTVAMMLRARQITFNWDTFALYQRSARDQLYYFLNHRAEVDKFHAIDDRLQKIYEKTPAIKEMVIYDRDHNFLVESVEYNDDGELVVWLKGEIKGKWQRTPVLAKKLIKTAVGIWVKDRVEYGEILADLIHTYSTPIAISLSAIGVGVSAYVGYSPVSQETFSSIIDIVVRQLQDGRRVRFTNLAVDALQTGVTELVRQNEALRSRFYQIAMYTGELLAGYSITKPMIGYGISCIDKPISVYRPVSEYALPGNRTYVNDIADAGVATEGGMIDTLKGIPEKLENLGTVLMNTAKGAYDTAKNLTYNVFRGVIILAGLGLAYKIIT